MADDKNKDRNDKKDEKKKQPDKKVPEKNLFSAITIFIGTAKSTRAQPRLETWLLELSKLERHLVEIKFKTFDPLSGSVIIKSIVTKETVADRYRMATGYGLFDAAVINKEFGDIFLGFEKNYPDEVETIENFIVSLSDEEVNTFRFGLIQNKQRAEDILFSISRKSDLDKMKKSAKARNLI